MTLREVLFLVFLLLDINLQCAYNITTMNNATVINIRTDTKIKNDAQEVVEKLGLNLSAVINAYLRQLIRTKTVSFSLNEEATDYLLKTLKQSQKDIKNGFLSPSFSKADEAIKWLNKSNKKYASQL